jgi:hypothetical protein
VDVSCYRSGRAPAIPFLPLIQGAASCLSEGVIILIAKEYVVHEWIPTDLEFFCSYYLYIWFPAVQYLFSNSSLSLNRGCDERTTKRSSRGIISFTCQAFIPAGIIYEKRVADPIDPARAYSVDTAFTQFLMDCASNLSTLCTIFWSLPSSVEP